MTDRTARDAIAIATPFLCALAAGATRLALSAEEHERAAAFLHPADRDRFVAAHWLKRQALNMAGNGGALVFSNSAGGKPRLAEGPEFSLSHGGGWIALALGRTGPVGVDVESERAPEIWQDVLPLVAGAEEEALDPLRLWTAKEAALKCLGSGFLSNPKAMRIVAHERGFEARQGTVRLFGQWRPADDTHCLALATTTPAADWRIVRTPQALRDALAGLRGWYRR